MKFQFASLDYWFLCGDVLLLFAAGILGYYCSDVLLCTVYEFLCFCWFYYIVNVSATDICFCLAFLQCKRFCCFAISLENSHNLDMAHM